MRPWLPIAAFPLFLAASATFLLGQMHGGSRGGGSMGRGGISSGGAAGFRSGSSFGGGQRFGGSFSHGLHRPVFSSGRSFGRFGGRSFGRPHFHRPTYFSTVYPYYSSGFYATPDYDPAYGYYGPAYYSAQNDAQQQQAAQQQEDIDRLEQEVARLREQRESGQLSASPASRTEDPAVISIPTLLIFRDKHTQEVQNYAIVGGTLWIFTEQKSTKLPLSWLDIDATTRANEDRGVDFQLPK